MGLLDRMTADGHEQVVVARDARSGLRAIVAVHSTRLGPALGGTRFHPYASDDQALDDVLRLARAMTYKAAVAGLDLGGGKAVIVGDPRRDRTDELIRAYGRVVDSLGGRYLTAEDVGTTQTDMDLIGQETRYVTGASEAAGGSGDPSPATAYGLLLAMRAVARHLWGGTSLRGRHVTVAGVGKVGTAVVRHLTEEGARVTVADVDRAAVARAEAAFGVEAAGPETIHRVECDIYSPCALGGVLNPTTIPELRCTAVVGCANNQLAEPSCGDLLHRAGVLYATDYVVNAGGIINLAEELAPGGYRPDRARAALGRIFDTTAALLARAEADGVSTAEAAERMADDRLGGGHGEGRAGVRAHIGSRH